MGNKAKIAGLVVRSILLKDRGSVGRTFRTINAMLSGSIALPSAIAAGSRRTGAATKMPKTARTDFEGRDLTLVFTQSGTAELEDPDGEILWASDEDGDFRAKNPDELLGENDSEEVLTYLSENGFFPEDDIGDVDIEIEGADFDEVQSENVSEDTD